MNDGKMRCHGCRKVLLNYPEPYLGTPEGIASAPEMHVRAQRDALLVCSECQELDDAQSEAFARSAREHQKRNPDAVSYTICSSGPGYRNAPDEWEDFKTGAKGGLGWMKHGTKP